MRSFSPQTLTNPIPASNGDAWREGTIMETISEAGRLACFWFYCLNDEIEQRNDLLVVGGVSV